MARRTRQQTKHEDAGDDYTADPRFERKAVGVVGVKVLDPAQGIVEAFVSGIGNVDDGGDVVMPTFFESSLEKHLRKLPKGVWSHDWDQPVAKTLETYTVPAGDLRLPQGLREAGAGGQYVKGQFNLGTQRGREAFADVQFFGDQQEWSIGYVPLETEPDENGNRQLKEGAWYEWSPVLFGMNPLTATVGVKELAAIAGMSYETAFARLRAMLDDPDPRKKARVLEAIRDMGSPASAAGPGDDDDEDDEPEDKAVSDASWDGSASRFDDAQWKRAAAACEGKADATPKQDCYLPHHEPSGAVSRNGVHAAAARFNQTTRDNKDKARAHLASHYKNDLGEDVPAVLGGAKDAAVPDYRLTPEGFKDAGWNTETDVVGDVVIRQEAPAETKQADLSGSFEERIGEVDAAFRGWLSDNYDTSTGDVYGWTVATFDDHAIGCVNDWAAGERTYWDFPYTIDATPGGPTEGQATLGTPTQVELVTTVVPAAAGKALAEAIAAKAGRRHSYKDEEAIQAIHDGAIALGASCPDPEAAKGAEGAPAAPGEPVELEGDALDDFTSLATSLA